MYNHRSVASLEAIMGDVATLPELYEEIISQGRGLGCQGLPVRAGTSELGPHAFIATECINAQDFDMLQSNIHTCIIEESNTMSYAQQLQHCLPVRHLHEAGTTDHDPAGSLGWGKRGRRWTSTNTGKGIRLLLVRSGRRGRGGGAAGRIASWHALGYIDARMWCTPSSSS